MVGRVIFVATLICIVSRTCLACLYCKDFFANNEKWRIVSEAECWSPKMHYYFNCLGYIQCDKLANGQYNASLKLCPQTSQTTLSGFDPDEGTCSDEYNCISSNEAEANAPNRVVPGRECQAGKRIHESDCKKYYNCGPVHDGKVQATLQSCETELGKSKVRFNPVLMACEEGEYPENWECNKNTLK